MRYPCNRRFMTGTGNAHKSDLSSLPSSCLSFCSSSGRRAARCAGGENSGLSEKTPTTTCQLATGAHHTPRVAHSLPTAGLKHCSLASCRISENTRCAFVMSRMCAGSSPSKATTPTDGFRSNFLGTNAPSSKRVSQCVRKYADRGQSPSSSALAPVRPISRYARFRPSFAPIARPRHRLTRAERLQT